MITVYKSKPHSKEAELVNVNDVFFNIKTVHLLDERAKDVISIIDHAEMLSQYSIKSRFDSMILNIDRLSTGCKTVLNIMYNPEIVFDIRECGDNALDIIYSLSEGKIYCDYPLISFEMLEVFAYDKKGKIIMKSYEELKEWWKNEN